MRATFVVLLCAVALDAIACSCAGPGTPASEFAQNDAIFLARVVNMETILNIRLAVRRTWKGDVPKTLDLRRDVCGYPGFEEGRDYLVYARGPQRSVSMCSRTRPAAEALLEMELLDELAAGRSEAAFLSRMPEVMLNDGRPAARAEAARLLARDAPHAVASAAIPSFVRALRDPSPAVRASVVAALDRGWGLLDDQHGTIIRAFIGLLDDRDPAIRAQVARSLEKGRLVPETEPALVAALAAEQARAKPDRAVLSSIASTLAVIGSPPSKRLAVPLLVRDLQSSATGHRSHAAERLGKIGPDARSAVQPLVETLRDGEKWTRYYAAGALGEIGAREAVPQLVALLDDPERDVRAQAAWAIFMTGDDATLRSRAMPVLIRSLQTAAQGERYHLIRVIGEIGPEAHAATPALGRLLTAVQLWEHTPIVDALRRIGPRAAQAVPAILFVLAKNQDVNRVGLVHALEAIDDRSAPVVQALQDRLQDGDEHLRSAAAVLLAKWGVPAGRAYIAQKLVPPLVAELSEPGRRREALQRLVALGDFGASATAAVPALRQMLSIADDRRAAVQALGTIGRPSAPAVPELIAFLRDPDPWTRVVAAEALRKIGTPEARRAFDAFAPAEVIALERKLRDRNDRHRGEAARYLTHLAPHSAAALKTLIAALDDPDWLTRTKSAEALGALGTAAAPATAALTRARDDRNSYVREAAANALKRFASLPHS